MGTHESSSSKKRVLSTTFLINAAERYETSLINTTDRRQYKNEIGILLRNIYIFFKNIYCNISEELYKNKQITI